MLRTPPAATAALDRTLVALQAPPAACAAYLVTLAAAAACRRPARPDAARHDAAGLRLIVLVPAHDEEPGIGVTIASLQALSYPADRVEVLVVADNCTDATAAVARAAGVTVWERAEPADRGKGQALAWALGRLREERPDVEGVAIVDADCVVSENFASVVSTAMGDGARAVQVDYVVSNPGASRQAALRAAGFALMNVVRPRGKAALGLSCGLLGTGMAFRADLLRDHPWASFSVTEDVEQHLRLVEAGEMVRHVDAARVASPMPTTREAARAQELRWEAGNAAQARDAAPRLVAGGLRARDVHRLHAGLERFVPSQSTLVLWTAATYALGRAGRARRTARWACATAGVQAVYVVLGLWAARVPAPVWRALPWAPILAARRSGVLLQALRGGTGPEWTRTER